MAGPGPERCSCSADRPRRPAPPVIVNGTPVAQAPKAEPAPPPAGAKSQLPVIINYPSAALQPAPAEGRRADVQLPTVVNNPPAPAPARAAPARVAVAYLAPA